MKKIQKKNQSKKLNTPPAEQNQAQPNEEQKDIKQTTNENEEDEDEDEGDEEGDVESTEGKNKLGTNEDLQGKLKKNEEISGKSIPGNKK